MGPSAFVPPVGQPETTQPVYVNVSKKWSLLFAFRSADE